MQRRFLNTLLLASFLYWSSGLGGYLHEKYEHWHPDEQTAADLTPAKDGDKPLQEADDHDECPTCQNLKMMKARAPDAPKAPEPSLLSVETVFLPHRDAPVLSFVVFIPARAPPALSTISA
jgi:hypothetical protein